MIPSNMKPVSSSNVDSIGYDESDEELFVKFNNGSMYVYKDVPESVWEDFQNADSKGRFIHTDLKDIYDYEKL
jgi:hypothetical protein